MTVSSLPFQHFTGVLEKTRQKEDILNVLMSE